MLTFAGGTGVLCQRREFLRRGAGLAGFTFSNCFLPQVSADNIRHSAGRAKSCVLVYLLGGPPHQDMFDLKPDAPAEIRGPFESIETNVPGIQICEHLPAMAGMADKYALVRSVTHNNHNHTPTSGRLNGATFHTSAQ
jgi:hypothetical protein